MTYVFEDFELDAERFELRRDGKAVAVEPQVFEVLAHLVGRHGHLVTKEELLDAVWGDRFVSESALSSRIKSARRALGDDGVAQRFIATVHGRGFRFVAPVREQAGATPVPGSRGRPPAGALSQEVRFCRTEDDVRLAYAMAGSGRVLVKAGNWLTHLRNDWESIVWGHWLRDLSARYRFVHHDVRGSGMSDWDVADVSFDRWVQDLETVVDAAGIDRFPLLGVSQGAAVATAFAARNPDRVSCLVLYGGYALGRQARARSQQERREAEMVLDVVESGWGREHSLFRQMIAAQFMPEGTTEQWDAFDSFQRRTTSAHNARRLLEVAAHIDVTEIAVEVRAPTLVLHADDDRRVPVEQGELLASLIPGARFQLLPSCNHLLLDGESGWVQFLDALDGFVRETG